MPHRTRVRGSDRRRQIIEVAMRLFSRQGFQGTKTRVIARGAGINEAILFRHFPRKEDLYWAVIEAKCRGAEGRRELQHTLQNAREPRQALAAVAEDILQRNSADPARSRLFLFSALENHRLSHRFFRVHIARYYDVLTDYIRVQIREGRFRRVDARLAARGFLGMIAHHYQIQELFGGKRYQKFNPRRVSETLADIWLGGMQAHNGRLARGKAPGHRRGI
jgi:AcrR family transcriptional regulator